MLGNPDDWKIRDPRVEHFLIPVSELDCDAKLATLTDGTTLSYKAVVVATGIKMPLIIPAPGTSLKDRMAEVRAFHAAMKSAKVMVINGAGLVGLELCGDFRAKISRTAHLVLLSRSGSILDTDFGPKAKVPNPEYVAKIT